MLEDLHDAWARWGWQEGLNDANCTTGWNLWMARGNAGVQTVGTAVAIYGVAAPGVSSITASLESRMASTAASEARVIHGAAPYRHASLASPLRHPAHVSHVCHVLFCLGRAGT